MSESRMSGEPHVRLDRGRLAEPRLPKPDERETCGPALGASGTQTTPSQPPTSTANEEGEVAVLVVKVGEEVPGYLGHPSPNWVSRDAEDVDHATFDLDCEQHVEPLEPDDIDAEEIRCEDACRLGA